ncbi:MAG: nuclear transport factor 2 family protein [Bacteroidota bacterium]
MKIMLFLFIASSINSMNIENPIKGDDTEAIIQAVELFSDSADKRNVKAMETIMHADFRAIVNRVFGSAEVSIMDKSLYLDLLKQGKLGGEEREVTIESIHLEGHNALVKATLEGKELRFITFMQLVKATSGEWKVISDMPNIEKK